VSHQIRQAEHCGNHPGDKKACQHYWQAEASPDDNHRFSFLMGDDELDEEKQQICHVRVGKGALVAMIWQMAPRLMASGASLKFSVCSRGNGMFRVWRLGEMQRTDAPGLSRLCVFAAQRGG
jgi:hypothetical protein